MAESYAIYLKRSVHEAFRSLGGQRGRALKKFIDSLTDNPFEEGDFSETDRNGRILFCKIVHDYAVTYYVDHSVKEVKIVELTRTP